MGQYKKEFKEEYPDLSKINDRGIKMAFQKYRGWRYSMTCGCCGETPHYEDEDVQEVEEVTEILRKELNTRGHVPDAKERKAIRQARGKQKRNH